MGMSYPISDAAASLPPEQLETAFQEAVAAARTLAEGAQRPSNTTLLQLYALYKQGNAGDATGSRPGITDFVARVKFDAWATLAGTDRAAAQRQFISLVDSLRAAG